MSIPACPIAECNSISALVSLQTSELGKMINYNLVSPQTQRANKIENLRDATRIDDIGQSRFSFSFFAASSPS